MIKTRKTKKRFAEGLYYGDHKKNVVIKVRPEILDNIRFLLKKHNRVCIERFGLWQLKKVKGRKYVHHRTGKLCTEKPYTKIKFKPSLPFKKFINKK